MDFFTEQDKARKRSGRLVLWFMLAVLCIVGVVYLVACAAYGFSQYERMIWWDPALCAISAGGSLLIILLGSGFRILSLSGGGKQIAEMVGGRRVSPDSRDADERRLLNVVEEMALASGTPVPPVYIMEESGINAFAAGYKPQDAVIGVTRGAVERLSRDELQGVIAHEFSHVLHGDMRLNIRLMGVLYGILMLSVIGSIMMRVLWLSGGRRRSSNSKDNGQAVLLAIAAAGLVMYILGYIGVFFGSLIKAAVSRQREFLADASAVQYTRNPDGIGGALKKLAGYHSKVDNSHASEASHFFFGPISSFSDMLSTHPPLNERIRRIDPQFNPELARALRGGGGGVPAGAAGFAGGGGGAAPADGASEPPPAPARPEAVSPQRFMASVGAPGDEHVAASRQMLAEIPDDLREAARDPYAGRALIYALLVDDDPAVATGQWAALDAQADPQVVAIARTLAPSAAGLAQHLRLPMVELALGGLDGLSAGQRGTFLTCVDALVHADDHVTPFEYTLRHLLRLHLDPDFGRKAARPDGTHLKVLLSAIAHVGNPGDDGAAAQAFVAAAEAMGIAAGPADCLSAGRSDWNALDEALTALARSKPAMKRRLLAAACAAVADDGLITPDEGDVVRAIAASLDCPVPPMVAEATAA